MRKIQKLNDCRELFLAAKLRRSCSKTGVVLGKKCGQLSWFIALPALSHPCVNRAIHPYGNSLADCLERYIGQHLFIMVQSGGYRFYLGYKYLWCYPHFALQDVYTSCLSCPTWECSTCLHDYRFRLKEHYAKKLSLLREVYVSKTFTARGQAMLREIVLWKYVFEVYIGPEGKEQVNDVDEERKQQKTQLYIGKCSKYIYFAQLEKNWR